MTISPKLKDSCDLAIVGAGPAGLAAAATAAARGVDVVLLDDQPTPGGQIYRAVTAERSANGRILGADYARGASLVQEFQASGAQHVPQAAIWNISPELELGVSTPAGAALVRARRVILATGAQERPFPIPGWTLPGVMTVGAAQILLKSAGLVGEGKVVLAGTGPLLLLLAAQYLRAGAQIAALLDTTPRANWSAALPHLPAFLASSYPRRGWSLLRAVKRQVPVIARVSELEAVGSGRLREVAYRRDDGPVQRMPADLLLLHQGVVPSLNLASAIGCRHVWDDPQLCLRPELDPWGASSVEGVAIAGDGAGIAGAEAAEHRGRLAALDAAMRLGRIDRAERDHAGVPVRAVLANALRGRGFLDALYRPAKGFRVPADATIVCRCEEVTARQIRDAVAQGCRGPNQLKAFLRCGMGPCQGRLCGLTVSELIADATGRGPAEIGYYRLRPPVRPISLAELAAMPKSEAAVRAVERT